MTEHVVRGQCSCADWGDRYLMTNVTSGAFLGFALEVVIGCGSGATAAAAGDDDDIDGVDDDDNDDDDDDDDEMSE
jgi:hypothetical protein